MDKQNGLKALDDEQLDEVIGGVTILPSFNPNPAMKGSFLYENIPQQMQEKSEKNINT